MENMHTIFSILHMNIFYLFGLNLGIKLYNLYNVNVIIKTARNEVHCEKGSRKLGKIIKIILFIIYIVNDKCV